jgi:S-adenosyl methyltransferase
MTRAYAEARSAKNAQTGRSRWPVTCCQEPGRLRRLRRYAGSVTGTQGTPLGLDVTTPNVARMYDYYLGGKDNYQADRIAAEKVLALVPGLRRAAVENRRFLRRVVRFLAAEAGVSQFLDIGVGLPTQGAVHEVVREVNPGARVVYADYDPVVVTHGQALLAVTDLSIMVRGDLRRPADLLARPEVRAHLDFGQPVAIGLFAWRPVTGQAAAGTPNIQWGAVGRKP